MLNVVYKINAKCIANRIKSKISKIIHKDQTGCVPGRYIGENIARIIDIIEYTEANNIRDHQVAIYIFAVCYRH